MTHIWGDICHMFERNKQAAAICHAISGKSPVKQRLAAYNFPLTLYKQLSVGADNNKLNSIPAWPYGAGSGVGVSVGAGSGVGVSVGAAFAVAVALGVGVTNGVAVGSGAT